jgi:hypothetical protein
MIINVDKEGKDFLVSLADFMLKGLGIQGLNHSTILLTNVKHLEKLDVKEPINPEGPSKLKINKE